MHTWAKMVMNLRAWDSSENQTKQNENEQKNIGCSEHMRACLRPLSLVVKREKKTIWSVTGTLRATASLVRPFRFYQDSYR